MHKPANTPSENEKTAKQRYLTSFCILRGDDNAEFFKDSFLVDIEEGSCLVSFFQIRGSVGEPVKSEFFVAVCIKEILGRAVNAGLAV